MRDVCPGGRNEVLIHVENGGVHCMPVEAILDVHGEKTIVDRARLTASPQATISHAHDAEARGP